MTLAERSGPPPAQQPRLPENFQARLAFLRRRAERLAALQDVCLELISERNLERLLALIMEKVTLTLEAERSSLYLVEEGQGRRWLTTQVAQGTQTIRVAINERSIAGSVATTGEVVNLENPYLDPRFDPEFDRRNHFRTRSMLTVPMLNRQGEIIGVTQAINKLNGQGAFTEEDEQILKAFSAQAAVAIENARYLEAQRSTFDGLIRGQAIAADARDHLTGGHTLRVTEYSLEIGREMALPESELQVLRYAGLLHDQGKLSVPDSVLQKPGGLSPDEFSLMKSHAAKTKLVLDAVRRQFPRRMRRIPEIASRHHERLDGSGYPDGLEAKDIPLLTRIIAVADVFDALTSKRHYREPAPDDKVLAILSEEAEKNHLDANVVGALQAALPRLVELRTRLRQEEEAAEDTGGLSGITHLHVIAPDWEKPPAEWSATDKPSAQRRPQ